MVSDVVAKNGLKKRTLWSYQPGFMDYLLSAGCVVMFVLTSLAIARGQDQWATLPARYFVHFGTLMVALAITPVMLLIRKGTKLHRTLGYVWLSMMITTAIVTLFIRDINDGGFSFIHLLSALTLIISFLIWRSARAGDHVAHRKQVHGIVLGALLIAGAFTFQFGRLFDVWLNS